MPGCSICVISLSVALGLQAFLAIAEALLDVEGSDHSYSSYEPYCNIWGHDYKVTY